MHVGEMLHVQWLYLDCGILFIYTCTTDILQVVLYQIELRRWRSRLERSSRKRKVECSNPSRDRPKS